MKTSVTIRGLDDVNELLSQIGPRQAINIMRATVQGVASGIAKDAKADAPQDEGDLKKAIKPKRERAKRGYLMSTVRVDPSAFYWRFLEYGQGPDGVEYAMFMRAVENFRMNMHQTFIQEFGKKWEAAMVRAAKRAA